MNKDGRSRLVRTIARRRKMQNLIRDPEMSVVINDVWCSVCNKLLRHKALFTDSTWQFLQISSFFNAAIL